MTSRVCMARSGRGRYARPLVVLAALLALVASSPAGATPRYLPVFLGEATPGRINSNTEVIGRVTLAGAFRAVILRPGSSAEVLPLPAGMASSFANDISDQGVVVGQVGAAYSPEFSGRAAAWYPDGHGGHTVALLGALPGQVIGAATAVNDRGDIVGWSSNGTYRYPVFFRGPGDIVDLTATGVFDPVDINEQRVLVDQSFTAKLLDLDTMVAQDLGVPPPAGGVHFVATRAGAINESGQVAASAILATSTSCDREAARYSSGTGWETFTSCGRYNGATDINDAGDVVMLVTISPYVRLEGFGSFPVESLIVNDVGHWYAYTVSSGWINNRREIVISASNPVTGQSGALLLRPEAATDVASTGESGRAPAFTVGVFPNPFVAGTMPEDRGTLVRFSLSRPATAGVRICDVTGRSIRMLLVGTALGSGPHEVGWDGRDDAGTTVPTGVYYAVVQCDQQRVTRTIIVH